MITKLAIILTALVAVLAIVVLVRRRRRYLEWRRRDELCRRYGDDRPRVEVCLYSGSVDPFEAGLVRTSVPMDRTGP